MISSAALTVSYPPSTGAVTPEYEYEYEYETGRTLGCFIPTCNLFYPLWSC